MFTNSINNYGGSLGLTRNWVTKDEAARLSAISASLGTSPDPANVKTSKNWDVLVGGLHSQKGLETANKLTGDMADDTKIIQAASAESGKNFANWGKSLLSSVGTTAALTLATTAITHAIKAISNEINAQEIAISKYDEAAAKLEQTQSDLSSARDEQTNVKERLSELSGSGALTIAMQEEAAVKMTNQTYVDALKKAGAFDAEAQKVAFEKTKIAVLGLLNDEAKKAVIDTFGSLEKWIETKVESTVASNKKVEQVPAA